MENNPLRQNNALVVSPTEEWEEVEDIRGGLSSSLLKERKKAIEIRKEQLKVDAAEVNQAGVEMLNQRINNALYEITNPMVLDRVMQSISSGKELNEAVKSVQGVVDLRDKLLDNTYEGVNTTKARFKIGATFANGLTHSFIGADIEVK